MIHGCELETIYAMTTELWLVLDTCTGSILMSCFKDSIWRNYVDDRLAKTFVMGSIPYIGPAIWLENPSSVNKMRPFILQSSTQQEMNKSFFFQYFFHILFKVPFCTLCRPLFNLYRCQLGSKSHVALSVRLPTWCQSKELFFLFLFLVLLMFPVFFQQCVDATPLAPGHHFPHHRSHLQLIQTSSDTPGIHAISPVKGVAIAPLTTWWQT